MYLEEYKAKIKENNKTVYTDPDQIRELIKCKRTKAYEIVKQLNTLRNMRGELVITGKIPQIDLYLYLYTLMLGQAPSVYSNDKTDLEELQKTLDKYKKSILGGLPEKREPISPVRITDTAVDFSFNIRCILGTDKVRDLDFNGQGKLEMLLKRLTKNAFNIYGDAINVKLASEPDAENNKTLERIGGAIIEIEELLHQLKHELEEKGQLDRELSIYFNEAFKQSRIILLGITDFNVIV